MVAWGTIGVKKLIGEVAWFIDDPLSLSGSRFLICVLFNPNNNLNVKS